MKHYPGILPPPLDQQILVQPMLLLAQGLLFMSKGLCFMTKGQITEISQVLLDQPSECLAPILPKIHQTKSDGVEIRPGINHFLGISLGLGLTLPASLT